MDKIISIFNRHGGYARMKDLKNASVQTRDVANLVHQGVVEKIKPGLYRLAELPDADGIPMSFIDVCQAIPSGIICLLSALEFYDLTTFNPSEIYVALPHSAKAPKIEYPPVRYFYFRDRFYEFGIQSIKSKHGKIRIFDREKSICDMFRYRKKLGEDIALEALKNYLKLKEANINKLLEDAMKCQVKTTMIPYLKALIAQ
jgi:predicted transcriptional regulator of viral defense system